VLLAAIEAGLFAALFATGTILAFRPDRQLPAAAFRPAILHCP
jgi:hypothetical protein